MPERITKAFDLESFLIERLRPAPVPVCLSWHDGHRGAVIPHGHAMLEWIERQLRDTNVRLVGHNVAGFDFPVLLALEPDLGPLIFDAFEAGRISDTMIRQQLYFVATRPSFDDKVPYYSSLAKLVQLIFDQDISAGKAEDAWRYRYGELYGVPFDQWPQEAIDYPLSDAEWAWKIDAKQTEAAADMIRCDPFLAYAAFCLALMACRGMRTDPAAVRRLEERWSAELERLRPLLIEAGLIEIGGTKKEPHWVKKDKPARERMAAAWARVGRDPMLTKSGEARKRKAEGDYAMRPSDIAIDKAACVATGDEVMLDRARYVLAEKIMSTYVPPMRAGTEGPLTTRFGLASTMRTTSSAPTLECVVGTNLQNAPRDGGVRECITARPGYVLLAADLAAAELHTLAEACRRKVGYSTLGDALNTGSDAHLMLAARLLGVPFGADIEARLAGGDKQVKDARQRSKPGNFGYGGAMGWRKFILYNLRQAQLYTPDGRPTVNAQVFTPDESRALREAWLAEWTEMQPYFDACKLELGPHESCVIELWPGGPLRRVKGLSMICNSYFQAPAAAGAKRGVIAVTRECHIGRLRDRVYPINFVHDEIVAELKITDPDQMHSDATLFAQLIQDAFNTMVPTYPTTVEPVIMTHYSKQAEPTYDSAGRLVPWRP